MTHPARVYSALLRLYPADYREAFGEEMQQTFVDWYDDVRDAHGRVPLRFWTAVLSDEACNIARERIASLMAFDVMRPVPLVALLLFLLFVSAVARAPAQEPLRPLPIDALVDLNTLSYWGIGSLSPDGKWLVYTVREGARLRGKGASEGERYLPTGLSADYTVGTNLYLVDTKTGKQARLTDDTGRYEEPLWSPDGTHVAFYADRDGVGRVWVWELATRRMRKLADDAVRPSAFAHLKWAPDSRSVIALLASRAPTAQRSTATPAGASPQVSDTTVTPGATVRVYRAQPRVDSVQKTATGIDTVSIDTVSIWGHMDADLATIRIADGMVKRLVINRPLFWYEPSPDGKWIAFSRQSALVRSAGQGMYDYGVVPLAGGEPRTVVRRGRSGYGSATWSPDSKTLAYVAIGTMANGDIFLADVDAGRERQLTTAAHQRLLAEDATTYWSPDGAALYLALNGQVWKAPVSGNTLTPLTTAALGRNVTRLVLDATGQRVHSTDGGRSFTVTTMDPATMSVGFHRIDASTGAAMKLREEPRRYGGSRWPALTSRDGSTIVYLTEDGQHPPDLWVSGADFAGPRQLTFLNPKISEASLGRTRVIDYVGPQGQKLQAVLLYPGNYEEGKRYPLVVRVYPGPFKFANNVSLFGLDGASGIQNMQMWASRGYAVLYPEIPQDLGTPMRDLVEGVNAAVNKVIEMGVADPERLGVTGQSYGGYSTISVVTQTTRFKGAIMSAGLANLVDAGLQFRPASGTDAAFWTEGGQGLMGGTIWEQKQRYLENSPIMYLDRVRTPLLIVHGEDDDAVPVTMGDQIFVGLRRLGRVAEYRRYAGESHVISGAENVTDYWRAAIAWFERYVKNPVPARTTP